MTDGISRFVYVTYIRTTPEELWAALTKAEFIKQYWFGVNIETDWKAGSPWKMVYPDGLVTDEGEVAECDPPRRLALRWRHKWKPELAADGEAFCVIELEPVEGAVKLTINHTVARTDSKLIEAVGGGWPRILANLKSLLETGQTILKPKA
ncbi:MAG: SRPBCC family protein [Roseiarcus sp.]|jgi:uncharacterized protein YndB with AHSA1/START domain